MSSIWVMRVQRRYKLTNSNFLCQNMKAVAGSVAPKASIKEILLEWGRNIRSRNDEW